MNKKSIILSIICIIGLFCFTGCNNQDTKVNVITTSYETYDVINNIGTDYINITYLESEPTYNDIESIKSSDCFIYTGEDEWVYTDIYGKVFTHSIFVDLSIIDVDTADNVELTNTILNTLCTIDCAHSDYYTENAKEYLKD